MNTSFGDRFGRMIGLFVLLAFYLASASITNAARPSDEYIRGYATAVITQNYPSGVKSIEVRNGVIFLEDIGLSEEEKVEIRKVLSEVEGVIRVDFVAEQVHLASSEPIEALPMFLPKEPLFQPLLADPRWPHFSISYQRYLGHDLLRDVAAASFGESFGIYRFRGPWNSTMELGVQAGVFSIFDLDAESFDLINTDFLVGIPVILRKGNFTNMFRIFHQSSHLGDEFLLRGETEERIDLSYECADNLFFYHLPAGFRVYAGGGYLFRRSPTKLDPWSTQFGVEFRSLKTWLDDALRPVASLDVQNHQESDWNTDISARAGIQFENPDFLSRKLLILLEYYNGKSPNGQFYESGIDLLGIGVHLYF